MSSLRNSFQQEINWFVENQGAEYSVGKLRVPVKKYIAWVDILGSSSFLSIDYSLATNMIGQFHASAIFSKRITNFEGEIYPLVDGCYVASTKPDKIQNFLWVMIQKLAYTFIRSSHKNRFMVRGAISYGRIIESEQLDRASEFFQQEQSYLRSIVLGAPLAEAYEKERSASPFGIWVSESARQQSPDSEKSLRCTHWKWWKYRGGAKLGLPSPIGTAELLKYDLGNYLKWCERNMQGLLYPESALVRHKAAYEEYFDDIKDIKHLIEGEEG
ncbi:MAG: hypothetical protein MRY59_10360 [Aquisalinus sp.]|nr:hypothetical protein [Aquisalinus sp.]